MEADAEKMEPDSEMMQSVVEHQEVPVQDATVMPDRDLEEETTSITRKETMACQEMEERLEEEEPTSVDRKPEVAQQREVPVDDAVVKPVNGRKKRHKCKKQAAERCEEPKELTRGICGSRKKLAAACRNVSRRATVAWRKRSIFRDILTHENCGLQKEVTASRRKITRCVGHRHIAQNKTMSHQEARKEGRSGRDCGKARNATLT
jgi:hypothetical protein